MKSKSKEISELNKLTPLQIMATRLSVDPQEMQSIIMQTVMPNKGQNVTQEQFVAFLTVANTYGLDPLKKEIYAFPNKGAIQPIVSIDGWLLIINSRPEYDGMELEEKLGRDNSIVSVTCKIHRKDQSHPTTITEYFSECKRNTDPWKNQPIRMLRHKATIQCARYAFGLSGIMDEYDAQMLTEREINPSKPASALRRPELLESAEATKEEAEPEPVVDLIPVDALLESMDSCPTMELLDTVREDAEKYAVGTDERETLVKFYLAKKAEILRAEDAAKLAHTANKK